MDTLKKLIRNKSLTEVPINESTEKILKNEEVQSKIRYLTGSIAKHSDDYDEKYIKIKINFDDRLPLNKTIENPSMIIVVRAIFHESNRYYPHDF